MAKTMAKAKKKPAKKIKPVRAWAGISDGKLHCWAGDRYYEIYPTKALAKLNYETFVPVLITPLRDAH